ncbi:hypothetical protein V8C86DRAFT_1679143 [Haematococcus lacustris]
MQALICLGQYLPKRGYLAPPLCMLYLFPTLLPPSSCLLPCSHSQFRPSPHPAPATATALPQALHLPLHLSWVIQAANAHCHGSCRLLYRCVTRSTPPPSCLDTLFLLFLPLLRLFFLPLAACTCWLLLHASSRLNQ